MKAKHKRFFSVFGFILLTLFINNFEQNSKIETKFPKVLYKIPTYENSRLSGHLTSRGDPYVFVFLTNDKLEDVIKFYEEKLKMKVEKLQYRNKWLTVYQFNLQQKGEISELKNYIERGVEIISLNSMHRRVYKARVKIKIIVPDWEIQAARLKRARNAQKNK